MHPAPKCSPVPSRVVAEYFNTFGITAVFVGPNGKIRTGTDPARCGAVAAWWALKPDALRVAKAASANWRLPAAAAIQAAARELGVVLTPNALAYARAEAAVAKLNAALEQARRTGGLQFFNGEYQHRREEARANGLRFMSYAAALARLRHALAGVAAGTVTDELVERVFR